LAKAVSSRPPASIPDELTDEGRRALVEIGLPLAAGFNQLEIACQLGVRPREVETRLERLRAELRDAQARSSSTTPR
jgi:DNA-directed RNA polymerase specialized sigma24 family protein